VTYTLVPAGSADPGGGSHGTYTFAYDNVDGLSQTVPATLGQRREPEFLG